MTSQAELERAALTVSCHFFRLFKVMHRKAVTVSVVYILTTLLTDRSCHRVPQYKDAALFFLPTGYASYDAATTVDHADGGSGSTGTSSPDDDNSGAAHALDLAGAAMKNAGRRTDANWSCESMYVGHKHDV